MTFKECMENFPRNYTLVGFYETEQSFEVPRGHNVDDIEQWHDNPFWEDDSCYSFVEFEPTTKRFVAWTFGFFRVCGYINETNDYEEFYPATHSDAFGWEIVDPFNSNIDETILVPDDELAMELGWPLKELLDDKWRREQAAYMFDHEAYLNGLIFTSPDAIKKFVKERQDLL